jgi:hypothetical protein
MVCSFIRAVSGEAVSAFTDFLQGYPVIVFVGREDLKKIE